MANLNYFSYAYEKVYKKIALDFRFSNFFLELPKNKNLQIANLSAIDTPIIMQKVVDNKILQNHQFIKHIIAILIKYIRKKRINNI